MLTKDLKVKIDQVTAKAKEVIAQSAQKEDDRMIRRGYTQENHWKKTEDYSPQVMFVVDNPRQSMLWNKNSHDDAAFRQTMNDQIKNMLLENDSNRFKMYDESNLVKSC